MLRPLGETIGITATMEVDDESVRSTPSIKQWSGMDSDDETLKFDKDDDLYDSGLDEDDARWVVKQVTCIDACRCVKGFLVQWANIILLISLSMAFDALFPRGMALGYTGIASGDLYTNGKLFSRTFLLLQFHIIR